MPESLSTTSHLAPGVAMELPDPRGGGFPAPAQSASAHLTPPESPAPPDALDRTLESAVERAFLSPRVVDQAAFDSLAGTLRKLTTDAQTQARALAGTSAQMGHLQESVRGLIKDLQARIDHALKALPTLDTRISRTQALLDRVSNETALTKARELRDSIIQEIASQRDALVRDTLALTLDGAREKFAQDLQAMVRDALDQSRADAIRFAREGGGIGDWGGGFPAPAHATPPTTTELIPAESLSAIEHRLTLAASNAIATQLDALTLRAREALHEFESGVERIEARLAAIQSASERDVERAEQGEKSLEEAVLRAEMRLRTASADAERRTEAVATEIAEQLLALRSDAGTMVQSGREQLAAEARALGKSLHDQAERAVRERVDALSDQIAAHDASIAPVAEPIVRTASAPAPDTSADFARLAAARTQIEALLHQLDQSKADVAHAAKHCDDRTLAAATAMDAVEARFAALEARIELEAAGRRAQPPTALGVPARSALEAPATLASLQQSQAQSQLQAMQLQQLTAQAIQVGQWLTQVLQTAQAASHRATTHR
jgi:hypothetical protein